MVTIKLLVEGGKMTPGPAVAQQLGPMGVDLGKIISEVNNKTSDFKGMNVPVLLDVNPDTKEFKITVLSPPTSELLKKELGIEKASGARLKIRVGNLAFEQVISVAKQKHDNMLSNDFFATVKSVLGTCQALGIMVDNKDINELMQDINDGKYDALIKAQKTEVSPEKSQELKTFFEKVDKNQAAEKAALSGETTKDSKKVKKKK